MERIRRALERARTERVQALRPGPMPPVPARRPCRTVPVSKQSIRDANLLNYGATGTVAAAFDHLRIQVLQRLEQRGSRVLAVTSATPREGKTFVAINLAIALAAGGKTSPVLVDFYLSRPRVHERFGFVPDKGVDDCLRGDADPTEVLVSPEGYAGLAILPVRSAVPDPSALLAGAQALELFAALEQFGSSRPVILDLPPLLGDPSALPVMRRAGAALVVISDEQARRKDLQHALALLGDIPLAGTVLNGSRDASATAAAS